MSECWECHAAVGSPDDTGLCDGCRPFMCAECGNLTEWVDCYNCEDGYSHHDCGEDCCACAWPEDNVPCDICQGKGGWRACPSCQPRAFND